MKKSVQPVLSLHKLLLTAPALLLSVCVLLACAAQRQAADPAQAPEEVSGTAGDPESLRSVSERITKTYQVSLSYGTDVPASFRDYTVSPLEEPSRVLDSLQVVEDVLSLYPPTFFPAVREGFCEEIVICLAGELHATGESFMETAHAFTTLENDRLWLVLNAEEKILPATLIHELTHVTDYRLLGMHQLNEREWNRLNPPGFSYYNAYVDEQGTDYRRTGSTEYTAVEETDPARIYFCDPYSRTYAMEDRARLMELLLTGTDRFSETDKAGSNQADPEKYGTDPDPLWDKCFSSPHVQTKLRFYFYTLRQAFANSRWPQETAWEEALRAAQEQ